MAHDGVSYPFDAHNHRFRYDDGIESSHNPIAGARGWMAAENTKISVPLSGYFRLRYGITKTSLNGNHNFMLAYSKDGAAYAAIRSVGYAGGDSPIANVASDYVTDWDDTTNYDEPDRVWADGSWTNDNNGGIVTTRYTSITDTLAMDASSSNKATTIEFMLKFNMAASPQPAVGENYKIRPYLNGLIAFQGTYNTTAELDVVAGYHEYMPVGYRNRRLSGVVTR